MQKNNTTIMLDDLQIAQVEALANYLSIEQVAGYFNLSASDFLDLQKKDERVLRAYRKGKITGVVKVAQLLWQQIEAENLTAIIFFLKTRGGWSERPLVESEDNPTKFKKIKLIFKGFEDKSMMQETKEIRQSTFATPVGQPREVEHETGEKGALGEIAKKAAVSHTIAEQYNAVQHKGTEDQKAEVVSGNAIISKAEHLETLIFQRGGSELFIPIPLGVMVTKEATEVMATL